jgi:hypothetical protein
MNPESHFDIALQSPAKVDAKDRAGWVGLFHREGFVEDPVEAGRYERTANIELFWDVFIGPQPSVRFEVTRDFWGGDVLMRRATVVSVTEADANTPLRVPALICYTLREGQVGSLQAVWEPSKVISWFLGRGAAGLRALSRHSLRMMRRAGLRNGLAFGGTVMGGLGHDRARTLIEALRGGDPTQWTARMKDATITLAHGDETQEFTNDPLAALERLHTYTASISRLAVTQVLVCGGHIAAFLDEDEGEGALALMIRATKRGQVESMRAIWSASPRVLGEPTTTSQNASDAPE